MPLRSVDMEQSLLDLSREIHAISTTGITFCENPFDIERFTRLQEIAAELIAKHSDHSKKSLGKVFSAEVGYATPKIDVRAAVFRDGRILMVKETESGAWTLPGGYVDVNECLSRATEREVREESGVIVKARKVAAIFDHRMHGYQPHLYHFYKIYMICDDLGGSLCASMETVEPGFFSKTDLETLPLDPGRITKSHVLRMFEHSQHPELPTDFD